MLELFAVTNRGLESICAEEMARLSGLHITALAYRRVHARFGGTPRALLALRTVDDIFMHLAEWHGISSHRSALAQFEAFAQELDLWHAVNIRADLFPLGDDLTFSVSANFVGRRNYTADEIKLALAAGVTAVTGWQYQEDDRQSALNLRIFIEHERAVVGLRLANSPLYKRSYKQAHVAGSLKPSVAAALVLLSGAASGASLLDPCCGAGTILVEAAAMGLRVFGGDQTLAAVVAATQNITNAGVAVEVRTWDARALPLPDASVDCIVSNLPWGRQVEVDSALEEFYAAACAEMARVLVADGRLVLLTNLPHLVTVPARAVERHIEVSLFGQQPAILLFGSAEPPDPAQQN